MEVPLVPAAAMSIVLVAAGSMSCGKKATPSEPGSSPPQTAAADGGSADSDDLSAIKTEFVPRAVLTQDEIRSVIELAHKCGIAKVAEIRTYPMHPSSDCAIMIKGEEALHGRRVSFTSVNIDFQSLNGGTPSDELVAQVGRFRAYRRDIDTDSFTLFTTRSGTIRVRMKEDFPIQTAERIIDLFAAGRIAYPDDDSKETLLKTNLSRPFALEATEDDDRFHISFPRGAFGWYGVEFNLKATEVEVITISGGIS